MQLTPDNPVERADPPLWYPPLTAWKLYFLIFFTFGVYSFFFIYRTARDLRDHADSTISPGWYPVAIPFGLIAAFAGARLATTARENVREHELVEGARPGLIGLLIFVSNAIIFTAERLPLTGLLTLVGMAIYPIPWLLLQQQTNSLRRRHESVFRTPPNKFTKLQVVALIVSVPLFIAGSAVLVYQEIVRWGGESLPVGIAFQDPAGAFSLTPMKSGWVVVPAGTLADEAALELYGPSTSDYAVVYVNSYPEWTVDSVVESRHSSLREFDEDLKSAEQRTLLAGTNLPASYAKYEGIDPLEGRYEYHVRTIATEQKIVELIVYTAGKTRSASGAEGLAKSLQAHSSAAGNHAGRNAD